MNMRLLGAPTIADVVPGMVDTSALGYSNGGLTMYDANCEYRCSVKEDALMIRAWRQRREDESGRSQGQAVRL